MLRATLNISWEKKHPSPTTILWLSSCQASHQWKAYALCRTLLETRARTCHFRHFDRDVLLSVYLHQSTLHSLVQTMNDMQKKANPNYGSWWMSRMSNIIRFNTLLGITLINRYTSYILIQNLLLISCTSKIILKWKKIRSFIYLVNCTSLAIFGKE